MTFGNKLWWACTMNTAVHECKECFHRRTKERLLLQPLFVIFGQFHKVFFSPLWLQLWQPSRPFGHLWLHAAVPQKTHLPKVDGKSTHVEPAVNQQIPADSPHWYTQSELIGDEGLYVSLAYKFKGKITIWFCFSYSLFCFLLQNNK